MFGAFIPSIPIEALASYAGSGGRATGPTDELAANVAALEARVSYVDMSATSVIGFLLEKISYLEHEINKLKAQSTPVYEEPKTTAPVIGSSFVLKV